MSASRPGDPRTPGPPDTPPVVPSRVDPNAVRRAVARWAGGRPPSAVEVRETHISWVFLVGDRAFKLKKPVAFDFVDYATPARRRDMCHAEVRLNRALAPHIYLGVRPLIASPGGLAIGEGGPAAVDYLVEMRRYDERGTLAAAIARSQVQTGQLRAVGRRLAAYHASRPRRVALDGAGMVRRAVRDNAGELRTQLADPAQLARVDRLARFMERFMDVNHALLDRRAREGHRREGHGDLRAEHIILEPELQVVDCVEFSQALRTIDVADDLAFLIMDLLSLDAEPSGRCLIDAYRGTGGDCGPRELVWFYATHRALVRAKVALLRGAQASSEDAVSGAAEHRLKVADRCAWRARGPLVLVICGPPAAGKSQLAAHLGAGAGVPVFNSDVVRKLLAGLAPDECGPAEIYTPAFTSATYAELGRRVAAALGQRTGVVVDATFGHRQQRAAFATTCPPGVPVYYVRCQAPTAVLLARARERAHDPASVSDATPEIAAREQVTFEALDEIAPADQLTLDTDRSTSTAADELLVWLDRRLVPVGGSAEDAPPS